MPVFNCLNALKDLKQTMAKNLVVKYNQFEIPKRLWRKLVAAAKITESTRWAELSKEEIEKRRKVKCFS